VLFAAMHANMNLVWAYKQASLVLYKVYKVYKKSRSLPRKLFIRGAAEMLRS